MLIAVDDNLPKDRLLKRILLIGYLEELYGDRLFPTGSRWFGNATKHSDWDYFTDDNSKAIELVNAGFKESDYWYDSNTLFVFRHESGVDLQICHNLNRRRLIQFILKSANMVPSPSSKWSMDVWNRVYKLMEQEDINDTVAAASFALELPQRFGYTYGI